MYGMGISKVGEIVDLGVELEIIKKSGSWFSYEGNKLNQGRDAVKQLLIDNPELSLEIETKIRAKVASIVAGTNPLDKEFVAEDADDDL
jgi:recombination protein RecA